MSLCNNFWPIKETDKKTKQLGYGKPRRNPNFVLMSLYVGLVSLSLVSSSNGGYIKINHYYIIAIGSFLGRLEMNLYFIYPIHPLTPLPCLSISSRDSPRSTRSWAGFSGRRHFIYSLKTGPIELKLTYFTHKSMLCFISTVKLSLYQCESDCLIQFCILVSEILCCSQP